MSLAALAESSEASPEQLLILLDGWAATDRLTLSESEESVFIQLLPGAAPAALTQTVQRDAHTQVGNNNALTIYQHVPPPAVGAGQLRRDLQQAMQTYLEWLAAPRDTVPFAQWFDQVDQAAEPLIRTLAAAEAYLADDVLVGELDGFLQEAFPVLRLRLPSGEYEMHQTPARIYPLAHVAYALAILGTVRSRTALFDVLTRPTVSGHGQKMGWIYLLHYLNQVKEPSAVAFDSFTKDVVPTQNRILGLLAGQDGWLDSLLPRFGKLPKVLVSEAVLAVMIYDVELKYFKPHSAEPGLYKGVYTWHAPRVQTELHRYITGTSQYTGTSNLTLCDIHRIFLSDAAKRFEGWSP